MTAYRYTSQGTDYVRRTDPGRVRNDGSRLETAKRMSRRECAGFLLYFAGITTGAIAASLYLTA